MQDRRAADCTKKRVPQPRKPSTLVSSPTRKKRTSVLQAVRKNISGNSEDDSIRQQGAEINTKTKKAREQILKAATCEQASVSSQQGSALRTRVRQTWSQYRIQKIFLKTVGVQFESENKERHEQKEAMFGDVVTEKMNLLFVSDMKMTNNRG